MRGVRPYRYSHQCEHYHLRYNLEINFVASTMSSSEVVIEEVTKSENVAEVVSTSLELERVVTAAVQAAVEPLQRSINDLTTSVNDLKTSTESLVRYFNKASSEMISPSHVIESYNLPLFTSSSDLTMVQCLIKEFRSRPQDELCLLQAQLYLKKHSPTLERGILWWTPSDYPPPGSKLSRDSALMDVNLLTTYNYDHSGIWKKTVCSTLPPQVQGHKHDVLFVLGLDDTVTVVDWNIGNIPLSYIRSAILLVMMNCEI